MSELEDKDASSKGKRRRSSDEGSYAAILDAGGQSQSPPLRCGINGPTEFDVLFETTNWSVKMLYERLGSHCTVELASARFILGTARVTPRVLCWQV